MRKPQKVYFLKWPTIALHCGLHDPYRCHFQVSVVFLMQYEVNIILINGMIQKSLTFWFMSASPSWKVLFSCFHPSHTYILSSFVSRLRNMSLKGVLRNVCESKCQVVTGGTVYASVSLPYIKTAQNLPQHRDVKKDPAL